MTEPVLDPVASITIHTGPCSSVVGNPALESSEPPIGTMRREEKQPGKRRVGLLRVALDTSPFSVIIMIN